MSPAALASAPLAGPRGPAPPPFAGGIPYAQGFGPPPYWGPPSFGPPVGYSFPRVSGPPPLPHPPLPTGPPPTTVGGSAPAPVAAVRDPATNNLRVMVERLQSKTKKMRTSRGSSRSDLFDYAITFMRKLHGSISAKDSPWLHAQMSMGLEIALAPKAHQSILCLALLGTTDLKDIDMKLSWIAEGVFLKTLDFCEAVGEDPFPEQLRELKRRVINLHRQERAKAVALVAKYPQLYGKNK
jgi:hypothetical protein